MPDIEDVVTGELAETGQWIFANITGSMHWPVKMQRLEYHGRTLFIFPVTERHYPGVTTKVLPGDDVREIRKTISNFLSAICWVHRQSLTVAHWSGGSRPRPMGTSKPHGSRYSKLDLSYLPEPPDYDGRLALALYREAAGLNHPGYAFLAFHRIIERKHHNSGDLIKWINNNIDVVGDFRSREVIARLRLEHPDVGAYLYASGRSAMVHAKRGVIVDPDDPQDALRIASEIPVIRSLAEHSIETEYGIETSSTIYRKHLYELSGFREIFGQDLVSRILSGEPEPPSYMVDVPPMRIELANREPYPALQRFDPVSLGYHEEGIGVHLQTPDGLLKMRFLLDFASERLRFDIDYDLTFHDNFTEAAARAGRRPPFHYELLRKRLPKDRQRRHRRADSPA